MRKSSSNNTSETKELESKSKNLFQMFFEKALGPASTPKKKKKVVRNKEEVVPRVSFNPMVAKLGLQ